MSWRHKFSGILLIFTSCLLDSFTTSFPIWTSFLEPDPDPEYGPFFQGDIIDNPWDRNGIPGQRYRWPKGIFKYHVSDDYSFVEMEHIYTAVLILVTETCLVDEELLISEETDFTTNSVEQIGMITLPLTSRTSGRIINGILTKYLRTPMKLRMTT
ncbi:unnamed protein product [Allacma fusca]|uniref:Uncharacterized protein n=1 Tax=Allacma fusca TaxID=39272 RepID=A0A8J2LKI2_9HEXA|nr:unnamed protein product [Allacma fusca]